MNNKVDFSSLASDWNIRTALPRPSAPAPKPHAILFVNDDAFAGVCAWCTDKVEADTWCRDHGYRVTHTICPDCRRRMQEEEREFSCRRFVA